MKTAPEPRKLIPPAIVVFDKWWREQSRKGDPARNTNLVREAFMAAFELGRDEMVNCAVVMAEAVRCEDGCDGAARIANAFRELQ